MPVSLSHYLLLVGFGLSSAANSFDYTRVELLQNGIKSATLNYLSEGERTKRSTDEDCADMSTLMTDLTACVDRSMGFLSTELEKFSTDSREHFVERKICNYMEQLKLCLVPFSVCQPDEIEELKRKQKGNMQNMVADFPDFDPNLCPSYRYFVGGYETNGAAHNLPSTALTAFITAAFTAVSLAVDYL